MKKWLSVLLCLCVLTLYMPTSLAADQTFTLMIYLCGTDLESDGGAASADLSEMIRARVPDNGNLTVLIQTGGTRRWKTSGLSNGEAERWTLSQSGMQLVDSLGRQDMGDEDTLEAFLRFGLKNYAADRYGLILWDHGSGASGGVCYDELSGDALFYPEIYNALEAASSESTFKPFAFIGFDACLMASYELALHIAPFAEYMIASEELEPGTGWDYSAWLSTLANNPGVSMETLGKEIVDSFLSATLAEDSSDYATLSVCDLSHTDALKTAIEAVGASLDDEIDNGGFSTISRLRQNVRSFGEIFDSASDMVDVSVFVDVFGRYNQAAASDVSAALSNMVVYSRHTNNLSNISGLSILIPFSTRSSASEYMSYYSQMNLSPEYTEFVTDMLANTQSGYGFSLFDDVDIGQQSVQSAQIDWFCQYADDPTDYCQAADSLWGDLYGTDDYTSGSEEDFSLDSFLSTLFGEDEGPSWDSDSQSSFWGDISGSSSSGSSSGSIGNIWGDLSADTDISFATNSGYSSTGGGLGSSSQGQEITISTQSGEVAATNPFANTQSDEAYTVTLTDEQMDSLGKAEANLMMDVSDPDFECYVELGYVQNVAIDWKGCKIYGTFDGQWASLDGQMVCIFDQIANERYIRSLVPVTVNGDDCYLLIVFDDDSPEGRVVGWTEGYTDEGMPARGYTKLESGDVVIPQYELLYWDENDEQQYEPFEGDPITVGAGGTISFGLEDVESDADYCYGFCLTDIYGNSTFTDFLTLSY